MTDIFGGLSTNPQATPPAAPATNNDLLFDVFSNSTPSPVTASTNQFGNFSAQPIQPNLLSPNLTALQQQRPATPTTPQSDLLRPTSPVAPPTVTSPFADLDFFGNLSSTTAKPTKESFFPAVAPTKSVQQLLLEKQVRKISRLFFDHLFFEIQRNPFS